jgi:hypothetical protein
MTHSDKKSEGSDIVRRLRAGLFNDDELGNMLNRLAQLFGDHDINLPHIPEDAGPHQAEIAALLARIPDGWGRWISCDAGWYPLITALGADLTLVDPDYEVHQIKEKFGSLRFYAETALEGERRERFDALIESAEARSAHICEQCGSCYAALCVIETALYSHAKTLCCSCCEAHHTAGAEDHRHATHRFDHF